MTDNKLLDFLARSTESSGAAAQLSTGLSDTEAALRKLEAAVVPEGVPLIGNLYDSLQDFSARLSLVGQVKAGKTALANGLLGTHGLLPSDVNPWTSVVTSMHVNVEPPKGKHAIFQFFSEDDWDSMVNDGGRVAELARKAKFDTKLDELTEQIKEMKRRTEARLGRNFKLLLGNQHTFREYNTDLIKRYVCLGEDDMLSEKEGRFADLTKSADLYMTHSGFPYPLTLADTPGVNDPFLIREAATLANLGSSDICIVVLSAHQALSTVDIGLMRILMSLQNQRIIVFVNRIDELENPDAQIKEINSYVSDMLQEQNLPSSTPIIFGSALWAEAALAKSTSVLPEDSILALGKLISDRQARLADGTQDRQNIDNLVDVSGISALRAAIDDDVAQQVISPLLRNITDRATEVAEQSSLYLQQAYQVENTTIDQSAIDNASGFLRTTQGKVQSLVANQQKALADQLSFDVSAAYRQFIGEGKRSLSRHLGGASAVDDWAPDTQALRAELNTAYSTFSQTAAQNFETLGEDAVRALTKRYHSLLGNDASSMGLSAPSFGTPGTPVSLMRTLTIDLSSGVISGWLKRRLNKEAYLREFEELALADMRDTLKEMQDDNVTVFCEQSGRTFDEYLNMHATALESLSALSDSERRADLQKTLGLESEVEHRLTDLTTAVELLKTNGQTAALVSANR